MIGDPLRDPQFPNRPQTPDFWRLSETILMLDGRSGGGALVAEVVAGFVDVQSALYMTDQRVEMLIRDLGIEVSTAMRVVLLTVYMGGLTHGIAFEQAGGHRA